MKENLSNLYYAMADVTKFTFLAPIFKNRTSIRI